MGTARIAFRPTAEDWRIIEAVRLSGEALGDVLRRALRLLDREMWLHRARADAARLAGEDLNDEAGAW